MAEYYSNTRKDEGNTKISSSLTYFKGLLIKGVLFKV